jgi:hypothetical protein
MGFGARRTRTGARNSGVLSALITTTKQYILVTITCFGIAGVRKEGSTDLSNDLTDNTMTQHREQKLFSVPHCGVYSHWLSRVVIDILQDSFS